jgi:hypothetical protein
MYHGGRCNPYWPISQGCITWVKHAKKLKSDALTHLQAVAYGSSLGAGVLFGLSYALEFWAEKRTIDKLDLFLNLAGVLTGFILPGLGGLLETTHPSWGLPLLRIMQFIAAGVNAIVGIVNHALGLYKAIGWLAQNAVDIAVFAIQGAISGVPGALGQVALHLLGQAVASIGFGFANQLASLANASFAEYDRENRTDFVEWCRSFSHGGCGQVPSY